MDWNQEGWVSLKMSTLEELLDQEYKKINESFDIKEAEDTYDLDDTDDLETEDTYIETEYLETEDLDDIDIESEMELKEEELKQFEEELKQLKIQFLESFRPIKKMENNTKPISKFSQRNKI